MKTNRPAKPLHYLREWRKKFGWSQPQLAARMDMYPTALSRYERGERGLTDELMFKFLKVFDITPSQFYSPPDTPSLDAMARLLPRDHYEVLLKFVRTYCKEHAPYVYRDQFGD